MKASDDAETLVNVKKISFILIFKSQLFIYHSIVVSHSQILTDAQGPSISTGTYNESDKALRVNNLWHDVV